MGGKFWSPEEQKYFVDVVMVNSQYNGPGGSYDPSSGMAWAELAAMMQEEMGPLARREYKKNMLYEHWYQTVKKKWGKVRAKMMVASGPPSDHGGTGGPPSDHGGTGGKARGSRAKKAKQRARKIPDAQVAPRELNHRSAGPMGSRDDSTFETHSTELPPYTTNGHQMGNSSAPEGSSMDFQGQNIAPERYIGPSIAAGPPSSAYYNYYGAPPPPYVPTPPPYAPTLPPYAPTTARPYALLDLPYPTHAEHATLHHRQPLPGGPERQTHRFRREDQFQRDSAAPAPFSHAFNRPQHRAIVLRVPSPEDDGSSMFVPQYEPQMERRIQTPRYMMELDAARTMADMHTQHATPSSRHALSAEDHLGFSRKSPNKDQSNGFREPPQRRSQNWGQNQGQLNEDER
ncbi:hypothetical protein NHQ30_001485 [Ciborinia camelliae]|nr:hypothetical protein NHQ30_001485 [Ciborinia camelliae]